MRLGAPGRDRSRNANPLNIQAIRKAQFAVDAFAAHCARPNGRAQCEPQILLRLLACGLYRDAQYLIASPTTTKMCTRPSIRPSVYKNEASRKTCGSVQAPRLRSTRKE